MPIKFVDLAKVNECIKSDASKVLSELLEQSEFIGGKYVSEFEKKFAEYLGVKYCISCGNGTDALEMSIWSLGIEKGDEVIIPNHTWISCASSVISNGGIPILAKCNPNTYLIDELEIEKLITRQTKAIMAVHLYGQSANMKKINEIASRHKLKVIEDASQAQGAVYGNKKCGSMSDIATFSFYPAKNLGALGDAGCIVTNDSELASKIRSFKNCGQVNKNEHLYYGRNSRLDNFQAAILSLKLDFLDVQNNQRREAAKFYNEKLDSNLYQLPVQVENARHIYHVYCIKVKDRKKVIEAFNANQIEYGIHYPNLLSSLSILGINTQTDDLDYTNQIISLPMYPGITKMELSKVVEVLNKL